MCTITTHMNLLKYYSISLHSFHFSKRHLVKTIRKIQQIIFVNICSRTNFKKGQMVSEKSVVLKTDPYILKTKSQMLLEWQTTYITKCVTFWKRNHFPLHKKKCYEQNFLLGKTGSIFYISHDFFGVKTTVRKLNFSLTLVFIISIHFQLEDFCCCIPNLVYKLIKNTSFFLKALYYFLVSQK